MIVEISALSHHVTLWDSRRRTTLMFLFTVLVRIQIIDVKTEVVSKLKNRDRRNMCRVLQTCPVGIALGCCVLCTMTEARSC